MEISISNILLLADVILCEQKKWLQLATPALAPLLVTAFGAS
jgi:hypothetical protein